MYNNLIAEMGRNQITTTQISEIIGKKYGQTRLKIKGEYSFSMEEAIAVKTKLFPTLDLEYLFNKENK